MSSRWRRIRSLTLDVTPLRVSVPYRALWIGQIVSLVGTQMRLVALAFQVFAITHSTFAVGLISLVELVPLVAFSIIGGAVADVTDRRRIVTVSSLGMLASSGALGWLSFADDDPSVALIYVLAAASSAFSSIERPARTAMAPNLVGLEHMPAVMALRQLAFHLTVIVGPAIGGLAIAAFEGQVGWVYLLDALTFFAALISLRWVPKLPPDQSEPQTRGRAIAEGLRFAFRTPVLMSIFVIDLVAMIFGMPRAVFPALAADTFDSGARVLGLLYAAPAVGGLLATVTSGWVKGVVREGEAVVVSVALWGAAVALAGLSLWSLPLTLILLAVAGGADVISAVFRGSMLLEVTPDRLRGRVSALNLMVVTGGPRLGDLEAGALAGAVGAPASIVIGGVASVLGAGVVASRWPALRRYRRAPTGAAGVEDELLPDSGL